MKKTLFIKPILVLYILLIGNNIYSQTTSDKKIKVKKKHFEILVEGVNNDTLYKGKEYIIYTTLDKKDIPDLMMAGQGLKLSPKSNGKFGLYIFNDNENTFTIIKVGLKRENKETIWESKKFYIKQ